MVYTDFIQRYKILAPNVAADVDPKKAAAEVMKTLPLSQEQYRFGHTKLFFKAGVVGQIEDLRSGVILYYSP